jgi:hypothetical protein
MRAAVQKTPGFDGNHSRKRALERRGRLHLISYGVTGCCPLHPCVTRHALARVWEYRWCGHVRGLGRMLKVNYFPHQMAIKLAEKGFLEKDQKS